MLPCIFGCLVLHWSLPNPLGATPLRRLTFYQQLSIARAPLARFPSLCLSLCWSCACCHSCSVFICAAAPHVRKALFLYSCLPSLALTVFLPLFCNNPRALGSVVCDTDASHRPERSAISHSQYHNWLWVSVLIAISYKRDFSDEGWEIH